MSWSAPFLSCDWGTSAFRLRFVEADGRLRREVQRASGCKSVFEAARERGTSVAAMYEETLRRELDGFADLAGTAGGTPALVISGMASSTIGWRELPYLEGPLKLDGSNLRFAELDWRGPDWLGRTILISGVAIRPEMMRGEETEAIGLLANRPDFEGTLVLPGTHSKHLTVCGGEVREIATFMTGELFELLARHSILKASISLDAEAPDDKAFEAGVRHAAGHGLPRSLFRVRTRAVLDREEPAANAQFLSGLLIGVEMTELLAGPGVKSAASDVSAASGEILLAGAARLRDRYARALAVLGKGKIDWSTPTAEELDGAVARAHALFLEKGRSG